MSDFSDAPQRRIWFPFASGTYLTALIYFSFASAEMPATLNPQPSTAQRDTRTKKNVVPVANDDDNDNDNNGEVDGESEDEDMDDETLILSSPLSSWAPTVLCVDEDVVDELLLSGQCGHVGKVLY